MVLRLRIPPPGNWKDAKCRTIGVTADYDPWFDDMDEALVYCNGEADGVVCPIREACLLFALTNNHKEGVWGGSSELTRRALRRRWPLVGKVPRPEWHWMTEATALNGMRLADLLAEEDDDDDEDEIFKRPDWDAYFLGIAEAVAQRADCSRRQYGAVIVKNHRIVSTGYNGAPAGDAGCLEGACPRAHSDVAHLSSYDTGPGSCIAVHAEANALLYADRDSCEGATIYITGPPCDGCFRLVRGAGITEWRWKQDEEA